MKKRTDAYLFTASLDCVEDMMRIEDVRSIAKVINKGYRANNRDKRVQITLKPRLGKNSPYRHLYRGRRCYTVLMEHASHIDVYTHQRYV